MSLLPKSREAFNQKEYWDIFFKKRGKKSFEWYGNYPELCEHLHKYIKPKDAVLIAGCGNSMLGNDLYDVGYKNITNIDISQVVIRQMNRLNAKQRPELKYLQMDALNMTFADETFTVVLDKGTLDALMTDDEPETRREADKYFGEVQRVSKIGARYVCVSLLQEHVLRKVLDYFPSKGWMLRITRCHEAEKKAVEMDESPMPVFLVICTKFKTPSAATKVLEVNLASTGRMQRCESSEEIVSIVGSVQQAALVCSGLRRNSMADQSEVAFDLYQPGAAAAPRFTVYVVDVKPERGNSAYAAFIVPQGRETEWLFSTREGRKRLTQMSKHNRLAIVTMHREHAYESLDAVQSELNGIVKNLALASVKEKIPFLSVGSDVGSRVVRLRGKSKLSGDYVVEDVEVEGGSKLRRLYFLQSQLVIQSEARLKNVKSRKGSGKEVVDSACLTCAHHVYMSAFACAACENQSSPSVAVIGLGGGGLCTFLRKFLPAAVIKAVDFDGDMLEVATKWFGLSQDEKLVVEIVDGVKFLERCRGEGIKYHAILFDVDSKDQTIGMSCPPKQFLEEKVVDDVAASLEDEGLFVLNVVVRDENLRLPILTGLERKFETVATYKLKEDLNEVFVCGGVKVRVELLTQRFALACEKYNALLAKNGHGDDALDVKECVDHLKCGNG